MCAHFNVMWGGGISDACEFSWLPCFWSVFKVIFHAEVWFQILM